MTMNIKNILLFALIMSITACSAQKNKSKNEPFIEIVKAQKGNTGFRGRVPKEDMNKPNQGHDFYILDIKALKDCSVEASELIVLKENNQVVSLNTTSNEGIKKFNLKRGERIFLKANNDGTAKPSSIIPKSNCSLILTINKKKTILEIQKIEDILPN
jgi:hypothetical protein